MLCSVLFLAVYVTFPCVFFDLMVYDMFAQ